MKTVFAVILCLAAFSASAAKVPRAKLDIYQKCRGTLDDFGIHKACKSLEDKGSHWIVGSAGQRPFKGVILRVDEACRYSQFTYVNYDNVVSYYESTDGEVRIRLAGNKKIEAVSETGVPTGESEKVSCVDVE